MSIATEQPTQNAVRSREDILSEINDLEARAAALRDSLPATFKTFFVFMTDKRRVWVYAETREEAERKLHARMNKDYGAQGWKIASRTVETYTDPIQAAMAAPSSLLNYLTRADALLFLADFNANMAGKPEETMQGTLARDIKSFEMRLRMEDNQAGR